MRTTRLLILVLVVGLLGTCALTRADDPAASRPNILFLFGDDHTYEALGCLGQTDIATPNLDRLAARGTLFTHAYNMGSWSGAVCIASRTMLVTGRSVWRAQAIVPSLNAEREAGHLWPQLLASAGYDTCFTGKWHVATPAEKCFAQARNVRPGMPPDSPQQYNRPIAGQPDPWDPTDPDFGGHWTGGTHWSVVTADDTIDFLRQERPASQPFFIYTAFNAPHDPRQSPREFLDLYPVSRIALPGNFLPLYPDMDAIGCGPDLRDERLAPFPRTPEAIQVHRREYYALISFLDAQIGRILDALEASGQAQNTWIFYTADHGLAAGHHGLMGKQNMYEHSLRPPLIVAGPGVAAGQRIDTPVHLQDIMATTLELAGVAKPSYVEFSSLLPLLKGQSTPLTAPLKSMGVYGAYLDKQRALLADGYKLIVYPEVPRTRLFQVATDPDEMNDLAGDPAHADTLDNLYYRLKWRQKLLDDPLRLPERPPGT